MGMLHQFCTHISNHPHLSYNMQLELLEGFNFFLNDLQLLELTLSVGIC